MAEQMNRDDIIKVGNKTIEVIVKENVRICSLFSNDEVLDLSVGNSVFRDEAMMEGKSLEVKERVICETKKRLCDMGLVLEKTSKSGVFNVSIENGGETEIAD